MAGTVGAIVVFPGVPALNFGYFAAINQTGGLATILLIWVLALPTTALATSIAFLWARNNVFRGEDCLHQTLWVCFLVQLHICTCR